MRVARPGVVGMAVRDQRALDGTERIDVEVAGRAIQSLRRLGEEIGCLGRHGANIGGFGQFGTVRTATLSPGRR
jgi:hypothetical protein